MSRCERCNIELLTKYGSGRFCSSKCSRSFSTATKRAEINEKVSKTLTKVKILKSITCEWCNEVFEREAKKNARFCSRSCSSKRLNSDPRVKQAASERMIARNERGEFFQSFGRRITFSENHIMVKCDSLIEWCAIKDAFEKFGDSIGSVTRSAVRIPYKENGRTRHYNPDFEIILKDGTRYLYECKSDQSGTTTLWERYHKEAKIKKDLLDQYCAENNIIAVWFTQRTRIDLYNKLKKDKIKQSLSPIGERN